MDNYNNDSKDNTYDMIVKKDIDVLSHNTLTFSNNKYKLSNYKHKVLGETRLNLFEDENLVVINSKP